MRELASEPSPERERASDLSNWQQLDRRTVAVTAITMTGVGIAAGVPTGIGIAGGAGVGVALAWVLPGIALLVAVTCVADWFSWRHTRYQVQPDRVELRKGVLTKTRRSVQRDRIRSVDVTADPVARLFGLVQVRIGTGEAGSKEGTIVLSPITKQLGEELRRSLLNTRAGTSDLAEGTLATFDRSWIRYAPLSFLTPMLGAVAFGAVMQVANWFNLERGVIGFVIGIFEGMSLPLVILILIAIGLVIGVIGSLGVWVELWWNFRLEREPGGKLLVRRGLLTTRATSLEEERLRGIELVEPLGVRLSGAARVDAVATGSAAGSEKDKQQDSRTLLPAAPREVADQVAAGVLREAVLPRPLTPHPVAARGRRLRWSLATVLVFEAVLVGLGLLLTSVLLHLAWITAIVAVPAAILLALDAYRALGHGLTSTYLLVRSGTVRRSTVVLQRRGVIGWTVAQSPFQRRAGLITLTATTAAGSGGYAAYDIGSSAGLALARDAVPGLVEQFLEPA